MTPAAPIVTPAGMHAKAPLHGEGQAIDGGQRGPPSTWVAVVCDCGCKRHYSAYIAARLKSKLCGKCWQKARRSR